MSVRRGVHLQARPLRQSEENEESEDDLEDQSAQSSASSCCSACSDDEHLQTEIAPLSCAVPDVGHTSRPATRPRRQQVLCAPGGVRAVLATVALIGLTAAAAYVVLRTPPPRPPATESGTSATFKALHSTGGTARALLESSELVDLATDQVMSGGHATLAPGDHHMVRNIVRHGFGNISLALQQRNPATARRLESFQLSEEQKRSVLHVVRHMGDPRVQQVGVELAGVVRDFLSTPGIPVATTGLGFHIQRALQPRLAELRRLRDEVIPAPLRGTNAVAAGHWGVALDTQSMRVVKTFDNDWNFEFQMSRPQRSARTDNMHRQLMDRGEDATKKYGVAGGVVEQARVVLDQFQIVLNKFGIETEVPVWVTNLDGKQQPFTSELISCIVDSIGDAAKSIMCPMKFASAGIDVFAGITGPDATSPESMSSSSRIKDVLWRDFSNIR